MDATRFFFDSFSLETAMGRVTYRYSSDAGHSFVHELTIGLPEGANEQDLAPAVFALGMAELAHYWKALLTREIVIRAGKLTNEQIAFWENLYTKGLGEFFYVNKIDFRGLAKITVDPAAPDILPSPSSRLEKALVPFGGGKDSLVTGELLKKQGKEFTWFELEPLPFGEKLREVSGVTEVISIGRNVEKNFAPVIELVRQGAPNGHVPITATYMLSAVLAAKVHGYSDVVMSLERSASEGNLDYLGLDVNHQYSKSFEFEQAISAYVATYIDPGIRVFSLLRPLYELQIVRKFCSHPQYFPHFISCNRGLKTGTWCGMCAKCAFMFAALSAFLPPQVVTGIFKKNLFEDETLVPLYRDLIGKGAMKPFDCVGTFNENLLALYLAGKRYEEEAAPLPLVLVELPIEEGEKYMSLLESSTDEHLIPRDYQAV